MRTILITLGDPAGVGPEIVSKLSGRKEIYEKGIPVVIGREEFLSSFLKGIKINRISDIDEAKKEPFLINLIEPEEKKEGKIEIGKPTEYSGRESFLYIEKASELIKKENKKDISLVTGPVSKKAITMTGFKFEGHTEFLKKFFEVKEVVMLFISNVLNVSVYSRHIPLKDVSNSISKEKIISSMKLSISAISRIKKMDEREIKVGVCGLNPHAGEEGEIGREEIDIIIPALKEIKEQGYKIEGPHSSDVVFYQALSNKFDLVFSWYHDQGLIPVKLLSSFRGVNLTWGLPFVRTSPLHGPAYLIAGKNVARDESLFYAYKLSASL